MEAAPNDTSDSSLVLRNGNIWTGCADRPEVQAVAVVGGRIIAIGSDREIEGLIRRETRVIDLGGARVVPGFADSHLHLVSGGFLLSQVHLRDAADEWEFGRRLSQYAKTLAPGEWLIGGNWDEYHSLGGKLPDCVLLDRFVADTPVLVRRYDGHMAVCNSRALELAGVGRDTPDPSGGHIDRDPETGAPTGILRDAAIRLVADKVPPPSEGEITKAARAAMREAQRFGVTSVDDMGGGSSEIGRTAVDVYHRLAARRDLTVRINVFLPLRLIAEEGALDVVHDMDGEFLRFGGFKGFYDGSLGARTALMFEPYCDAPGSTGLCVTPSEQLEPLVTKADAAGYPVAVHAIGDRGVKEVLDVFEAVIRRNGPRERCLRIEHAQHTRPEDIPRFGELGVVASMQPYHAIDDARFAEAYLGREPLKTSFAWRSLLDARARLCFGSDWPVVPLNPLLGLDAAVNRRSIDGLHPEGWFSEQCITISEAVHAYTASTIAPGSPADIVALSRDIFDPAEKDRIGETRVSMTIVGGGVWEF